MTPIPKDAMPAYKLIKETVPRPDGMPFPTRGDSTMRFQSRFAGGKVCGAFQHCCPLGMLESALYAIPLQPEDFDGLPFSPLVIKAYCQWFDNLTMKDAKEFMNFQWPKD